MPAYSYGHNFVSDLGSEVCTAKVCSPLHAAMNGGVGLAGLLAVAGALLLASILPRGRARSVAVGLAILHGIGSLVVALIPSAPGTVAGTSHSHVLGAYLAIVGGNGALVAAGVALRGRGAPAWLAAVPIMLGVAGFLGGLGLVVLHPHQPGLFERIAVDTITAGEVVLGAAALAVWGRTKPKP